MSVTNALFEGLGFLIIIITINVKENHGGAKEGRKKLMVGEGGWNMSGMDP